MPVDLSGVDKNILSMSQSALQNTSAGVGPTGPVGRVGEVGKEGKQGERGEKGERGPQGREGPVGKDGKVIFGMGPKGDTGPAGKDGTLEGPPGEKGERGERGEKGDTGDVGPMGRILAYTDSANLNRAYFNSEIAPKLSDATPSDPYIFLVKSQTEALKLNGIPVDDYSGHYLLYDGTVWIDCGLFSGPQGEIGHTGPCFDLPVTNVPSFLWNSGKGVMSWKSPFVSSYSDSSDESYTVSYVNQVMNNKVNKDQVTDEYNTDIDMIYSASYMNTFTKELMKSNVSFIYQSEDPCVTFPNNFIFDYKFDDNKVWLHEDDKLSPTLNFLLLTTRRPWVNAPLRKIYTRGVNNSVVKELIVEIQNSNISIKSVLISGPAIEISNTHFSCTIHENDYITVGIWFNFEDDTPNIRIFVNDVTSVYESDVIGDIESVRPDSNSDIKGKFLPGTVGKTYNIHGAYRSVDISSLRDSLSTAMLQKLTASVI